MLFSIAEQSRTQRRLYSSSTRHTLECNWFEYMQRLALTIGCTPPSFAATCLLRGDPRLAFAVAFGVLSASQYRLRGVHAWSGARTSLLDLWRRVETPFGRERAATRAKRGPLAGCRVTVVVLWVLSLVGLVVVYQFIKRTTFFGI